MFGILIWTVSLHSSFTFNAKGIYFLRKSFYFVFSDPLIRERHISNSFYFYLFDTAHRSTPDATVFGTTVSYYGWEYS